MTQQKLLDKIQKNSGRDGVTQLLIKNSEGDLFNVIEIRNEPYTGVQNIERYTYDFVTLGVVETIVRRDPEMIFEIEFLAGNEI